MTVIVLYVFLLGITILSVGLLLPPLIQQGSNLVVSAGKSWSVISGGVKWVRDISSQYGLADNLQTEIVSLQNQISSITGSVVFAITNIFGTVVALVIVLVMAYYIAVQEEDARSAFHNFVPEKYQSVVATILKRVQEKMSRWLLGQLSLSLIIGVMYFIGLSIIGIDNALVLAFFGGFCEFIPYLGPILGAIPVVVLALSDSPFKALLALIVVIVIQQTEGHVIVPKVMQKAVGLNPLVSITALLVGAELFGIAGALMAIPVATALSVIISELYRTHIHADES